MSKTRRVLDWLRNAPPDFMVVWMWLLLVLAVARGLWELVT